MAKNISIKVKTDDQATGPLNKVSGKINSLSNDLKKASSPLTNFGKSLKNLSSSIPGIGLVAGAIAGVTAAVKKTVQSMKEWETAWGAIDATTRRLDLATRLNENLQSSATALNNFAGDLSNKLKDTFSGGDIAAAMGKLAFDKTEDEIKQILTVATDLSAALGIDLKTAVSQLNGTLTGATGTLGKIFPELKNLTAESLKSGEAIGIIGEKVKGMAEEMSNSVQGNILRGKNLTGDLKEELGYYVAGFFDPIRKQINDVKEKWRDALAYRRTAEQAHEAISNHKGTLADYDIYINSLKEERASLVAWKNSASGPAVEGAERQIRDISSIINNLEKAQNELRQELYIKNNKTTASTVSSPATSSSSEDSKTSKTVKTILDPFKELKEQALKNVQQMQDAQRREDQIVELRIGNQKALAEAEAELLEAQRQAREDLRKSFTSQMGEAGSLIETGISGGWRAVLIELATSLVSKLNDFSGIVSGIFNVVSTIFEQVAKPLLNAIEPILNPFLTFMQGQGKIVGSLLELLQPFVDFVTPILEFVGKVMYWIQSFLTTINGYIKYYYTEFYNFLVKIYNSLVSKKKEKSERKQEQTLDELNQTMKGLFNGDFIEGYKQMLASNLASSEIGIAGGGSATYNAARDVYVTINYNNSFVNGDKSEIAIALAREIRNAEKMNLI